MIEFRKGQVYAKDTPLCPEHGRMRLSGIPPDALVWLCAGWDGEGCGHAVRNDDVPWVHLGEISDMKWSYGDDA